MAPVIGELVMSAFPEQGKCFADTVTLFPFVCQYHECGRANGQNEEQNL